MLTFLAGGTGTPKLLAGARRLIDPARLTVVANTGDDIELGGLVVCPDLDTVLFHEGGVLDTDRWWGIADDTHETNRELHRLAAGADRQFDPQYLAADKQTAGREIARWRRFSGVGEFMTIGDRDRAIHITRTSLLDEGHSLTAVTETLADCFDIESTVVPMSNDPVATIIETNNGEMHFQEYWVGRDGEPAVNDVEFRGSESAEPTESVTTALTDPVVIGPSNPVTSIGPICSLAGVRDALESTPVVAVSPFVGDRVFSGPAAELLAAVGHEPNTRGVADAYQFADAFVLDHDDETELSRPTIRTDTEITNFDDSERVMRAALAALDRVDENPNRRWAVDV